MICLCRWISLELFIFILGNTDSIPIYALYESTPDNFGGQKMIGLSKYTQKSMSINVSLWFSP